MRKDVIQSSILTADIRQSQHWYYTTDNECEQCIGQVSTQALRCMKHIVNQGPNIYIYVQSNFEGPLILNICEQIYLEDLIPNNKILKILTLLGPGDSKQGSQTIIFQLIMIRT